MAHVKKINADTGENTTAPVCNFVDSASLSRERNPPPPDPKPSVTFLEKLRRLITSPDQNKPKD
jgi:hypothetical protein